MSGRPLVVSEAGVLEAEFGPDRRVGGRGRGFGGEVVGADALGKELGQGRDREEEEEATAGAGEKPGGRLKA